MAVFTPLKITPQTPWRLKKKYDPTYNPSLEQEKEQDDGNWTYVMTVFAQTETNIHLEVGVGDLWTWY